MIGTDRIHLDLFTRQISDPWIRTEAHGPDASLDLEAIACRLILAKVDEQAAAEIPSAPTAG
jgi:hypothetical protein